MKKLISIGILLLLTLSIWAQKLELLLQVDSIQKKSLEIVNNIDEKVLFNFPISFQLTNKNILVIMFGNGETLPKSHSVWLFSPNKSLKNFLKENKNVVAGKEFKNSNQELKGFYAGKGFEYISKYNFDNGYENISKNPKPVFFQLTNNEAELYLYFYVSAPNKKNNNLHEFIAKVKPIKITIKIKTN